MPEVDETLTPLNPVILSSILEKYRMGRNPRIVLGLAHPVLHALGRPLSVSAARDLLIEPKILNGRNTITISDLLEAADAMIKRQLGRPNLKAAAVAKARAARRCEQPAG